VTDVAGAPTDTIPPNLLGALDDSAVTGAQWKIMLVSGMGFFTDAYDLFVIGIVVVLLTPEWHLSTGQVSLLNSATLAASAVGAIVFGRIADMIGRKRIYGFEVLILAAGAIASAFAPNYTFLLVSRLVLGIGIGGDYPVSATIMSEFSGKKTRGRMVGLVFAMQGAGLVVGPLIASAMLATGVPDHLIWRILLGLGAVPGLAVFYLRRKIQETPRFALAGGAHQEAAEAIAQVTGSPVTVEAVPRAGTGTMLTRPSTFGGFAIILRNRRLLLWLIGCSAAWMLLDFSYYGNSISSPEILKLLSPHASLLHNTLIQLLIFCVFALPGYAMAIAFMDRTGRKAIQILGFAMMGLSFFIIGAIPGVTMHAAPFVLLYGISYFFTEFGPNTTTFIYPAEIFPVEVRTTSHGIAAAAGKMGAFAGAYLFPVMLRSSWGIRGAELVAAAVSVVGLVLTATLLPEPKGKSLEELSAGGRFAPGPRRVKIP
jgi:PHS family inorganic phosphate transporter-like MFS transporter